MPSARGTTILTFISLILIISVSTGCAVTRTAVTEGWTLLELLTIEERTESIPTSVEVRNCGALERKTFHCSASTSEELDINLGGSFGWSEGFDGTIDPSVGLGLGLGSESGESLELDTPPEGFVYQYEINQEFRVCSGEVRARSPEGNDQPVDYRFYASCSLRLEPPEVLICPDGTAPPPATMPECPPGVHCDEFNALDERIWEPWSYADIKLGVRDGALHAERPPMYTTDWVDSAGIRRKGELDFTGEGTTITWRATIHPESFWSLMYPRVVDEDADRDLQFDCSAEGNQSSFSCDVKLRNLDGHHVWAAGKTIPLTKGDWHDFTIVNPAPREIGFYIDDELVASRTFSDSEWNDMDWVVSEWTAAGWAGHDNLVHASLDRYLYGP